MSKVLLLFFYTISSLGGFAQNKPYELPKRNALTILPEDLAKVNTVNDLHGRLWDNLQMDYYERTRLEQRRTGMSPQPANYVYPQENYKQIVDVTSVIITVSSNGKPASAKSSSDKLTAEQKALLLKADLGSHIKVQLIYKYKDRTKDSFGPRDEAVETEASVTVLPKQSAEFNGGEHKLSAYFGTQVVDKLSSEWDMRKLQLAVVKFTVSETGAVSNAAVATSSGDKQIDSLLLEALKSMPTWKPAVNSTGVKVKQEVVIPFGEGC